MFGKLRVWYLSTKTKLFPGAYRYWNNRYVSGGNSGSGSRGESLRQKCRMINTFIQAHEIKSILDLGCGDGAVAACLDVNSYLGVDVSSYIVEKNSQAFSNDSKKQFRELTGFSVENNSFDLAISLDVIFHIVNLVDLTKHLNLLYKATGKWVIISSTNYDSPQIYHQKNWKITEIITKQYPNWTLISSEKLVYSSCSIFIYAISDPHT